jgi:hypothetical protein
MDAIERARAYLAKLPPAISGQAGHAATFAAACRIVEFGLTFEGGISLLAAWNETHCQPPWTGAELKHKLADAFKCTSPKPDFVNGSTAPARTPFYPMSTCQPQNKNAPDAILGSNFSPKTEKFQSIRVLDKLHEGAAGDFTALAALRGLSVEAIRFASKRGLLRFGKFRGHPAWFILDASRRVIQARRLDGRKWTESAKAWTLAGSQAAWPLGIFEARNFPAIAFCEGGPDLLAAFHFLLAENRECDCAPVAMLGGCARIHPDALPMFAEKRVRIFRHTDMTGENAADRWAEQLTDAGAEVDAFRFDGLRRMDVQPVNDLNDLAAIHADDFEMHRCLWAIFPDAS